MKLRGKKREMECHLNPNKSTLKTARISRTDPIASTTDSAQNIPKTAKVPEDENKTKMIGKSKSLKQFHSTHTATICTEIDSRINYSNIVYNKIAGQYFDDRKSQRHPSDNDASCV